MESRIFPFFLMLVFLALSSCRSPRPLSSPRTNTDHYTTVFPRNEISDQLTDARNSILRIVSTAFYDDYIFEEGALTMDDFENYNWRSSVSEHNTSRQSTAGTSIVLDKKSDGLLLVTCAHVITSPDTMITVYDGRKEKGNYIQSISIKNRQNNITMAGPSFKKFEVLSIDENYDIALLAVDVENANELDLQEIDMPIGNSDDIRMGSQLYILGYPRGYLMVNRGIASRETNQYSNFFVTNALFNPGISGGLVVASKDNFRSFEWVGMARSASASNENILVPAPGYNFGGTPTPYYGRTFVQRKTRISYGITQTITINTIKRFLEDNEDKISDLGFSY